MTNKAGSILTVACLAAASSAGAQGYDCAGPAGWHLQMDGAEGVLAFGFESRMDVMLETPAEGADWPRAFTLVGDRDTAIVLIEREACRPQDGADPLPYRARVFTQRGQTPVLLTGCCGTEP